MEDNKIIELYWNRHEIAISETAQKYGNYCRSIAFNILANNEDTDECVNDTYLNAWKAIPTQRPNFLRVFLGRITRNIAFDKYDYYHAQKRNIDFNVLLSELEECISSSNDVESSFEKGEIAKAISDFLCSESSENRNIFIRRYWFSDSISTISASFKMKESKVKTILFRIRNRLKIYLEKEGIIL